MLRLKRMNPKVEPQIISVRLDFPSVLSNRKSGRQDFLNCVQVFLFFESQSRHTDFLKCVYRVSQLNCRPVWIDILARGMSKSFLESCGSNDTLASPVRPLQIWRSKQGRQFNWRIL